MRELLVFSGLTTNARLLAAYLVADELPLQKRALAARCFQIFKTVLDQPLLLDQPYPTPAALEEDGRMREVRRGYPV